MGLGLLPTQPSLLVSASEVLTPTGVSFTDDGAGNGVINVPTSKILNYEVNSVKKAYFGAHGGLIWVAGTTSDLTAGLVGLGGDNSGGNLIVTIPTGKSFAISNNGGANSSQIFGNNQVLGIPNLIGTDFRQGVVAADGAPITICTAPAGGPYLYRVSIDIFLTVESTGQDIYQIKWTRPDNSTGTLLVQTGLVIDVDAYATEMVTVKGGTNITGQLSSYGAGDTVDIIGTAERLE